jgi:hypothetical protein
VKRAVALLVLALPARAFADEPDPAATRVGEANLEPEHAHEVIVTLALGGGLTVGFGVADAVGRGGSGSLRLARRMTPSWLLSLEITSSGSLHKKPEMDSKTYVDTATGLLVGGQYYVGPSFWLRGAAGLAVYNQQQAKLDATTFGDRTLTGFGTLGGAGLEVARFHHVSIGFELFVLNQISRDGVVSASGLNLDFAIF